MIIRKTRDAGTSSDLANPASVATLQRAMLGRRAHSRGLAAEAASRAALLADGWQILGQRLRTSAGEIDIVAERDGLLVFVEVKARADLSSAASSVSLRQRARLLAAAAAILAEHPEWGRAGVRFDVLLVDAFGTVRRIVDAFRDE